MEEIKTKKMHSLKLEAGKHLEIGGAIQVESFCETQVTVKLENSNLIIQGKNLVCNKFNVDDGYVKVDGEITCIKYADGSSSKPKENFLKKIFK